MSTVSLMKLKILCQSQFRGSYRNHSRERSIYYVTLKDHKINFTNNRTCRLINPTKSEIGRISKQILDSIYQELLASTHQWKSTTDVLQWFHSFDNKHIYSFIVFDVVEFYPSVQPQLLNKAINFAAEYIQITTQQREIILTAKISMLLHGDEYWTKTSPRSPIDVSIGKLWRSKNLWTYWHIYAKPDNQRTRPGLRYIKRWRISRSYGNPRQIDIIT